MGIEPLLFVELLALGLCIGFLAGLLGIGGGMLMVPFLMWVFARQGLPTDHVVKMAVATSLATISFTAISSVRAHQKRGAVRWPVVRALVPGILLGGLLGARLAAALPSRLLTLLFAVFLAYMATQMLRDKKPSPGRQLPGWWGMFGMGQVIGGLSSMVGAGGAFVSVPFMTACNVSIHQAVGTASALGLPIALAGTVGYVWSGWGLPGLPAGAFGYLHVPGFLSIAVGSVLTAPWGAAVAHRMDVGPLKKVFAVALYAMAAYFVLR